MSGNAAAVRNRPGEKKRGQDYFEEEGL